MSGNINYASQVEELINAQMHEWALVSKNYADLNKIVLKKLQFNGFQFLVQFNPARIISSSAKIDKLSIEKRPCFLCDGNRPVEQGSLDFKDNFRILVNPYPIFRQHLTIIHKNHVPQLIKPYFINMLELAKELQTFTIFYNGPKCGASAPDHFHFQAGTKGYMPLEHQISDIKKQFGTLKDITNCNVWKIDDGIRKFFHLESDNEYAIQDVFFKIYEMLSSFSSFDDEPGLNVICSFAQDLWKVDIFPRSKHRPSQYSEHGGKNIIFSPGSVDLGGLMIIPLEKDFVKIDEKITLNMMWQIGADEGLFNQISLNI